MVQKAFIIDDSTPVEVHDSPDHAKGLIPRDYEKHPTGFYSAAPAFDLELIPRDQWAERIREKMANKANLTFVRRRSGPDGGRIPSLDQDGIGYCWGHSTTMCEMLVRAKNNEPYVRLSAFHPCCLIKNYQDEGGWGALSLDFVVKNGIASVEFWPEKSMKRSNDTPQMRENALLHRVTESWADLNAAVYDRNFTEDQAITLLLSDTPVVGDLNWWGHSVCLMAAILSASAFNLKAKALPDFASLDLNKESDYKVFADNIGKEGLNSWTDGWGVNGEFQLFGSKAKLDGGVAPRVVIPGDI